MMDKEQVVLVPQEIVVCPTCHGQACLSRDASSGPYYILCLAEKKIWDKIIEVMETEGLFDGARALKGAQKFERDDMYEIASAFVEEHQAEDFLAAWHDSIEAANRWLAERKNHEGPNEASS